MAVAYWRDDQGPKPKGYEDAYNPDKGFKGESSVMEEAVTRISGVLERWLRNPTGTFEPQLDQLRGLWIAAGGDSKTWEWAIQKAMVKVDYAKRMSKIARGK